MESVCNFNLAHKTDLSMGEKPPFNRKTITHGLCKECSVIFEDKAEQERRKGEDE